MRESAAIHSTVMQPVLNSIRVVEATEALAGPYCAMMLGDFGADVIKVERKKVGDQSRGWGPSILRPAVGLFPRRQSQQAIADSRF